VVSSLQVFQPTFSIYFSSLRTCYMPRSSHPARIHDVNTDMNDKMEPFLFIPLCIIALWTTVRTGIGFIMLYLPRCCWMAYGYGDGVNVKEKRVVSRDEWGERGSDPFWAIFQHSQRKVRHIPVRRGPKVGWIKFSNEGKKKGKAVPLHAMKAPGVRGGIARTHS
jgi:hypothetical protein